MQKTRTKNDMQNMNLAEEMKKEEKEGGTANNSRGGWKIVGMREKELN